MHVWTRLKPASVGVTGQGPYADGMAEHDGQVGTLLETLDTLDITNNTIVMYSTDNGAELALWPDGSYTPYRGEKNSNWEGGYRVPMMELFNLRMDPFERMDQEGSGYDAWRAEHLFLLVPAIAKISQFKATFKEFPQRQKPGSFVPW